MPIPASGLIGFRVWGLGLRVLRKPNHLRQFPYGELPCLEAYISLDIPLELQTFACLIQDPLKNAKKIELGKNPSRVCCLHLLFFWVGGGEEGGCICRWFCLSPTRPEIPNLALKGPGTHATRKRFMEFKVFASFSGRGHRVLGLKFQGRCRGFLGGGRGRQREHYWIAVKEFNSNYHGPKSVPSSEPS